MIQKRWSKLDTAFDTLPRDAGVYEIAIAHDDGIIELVYVGRGEGRGGIRVRVMDHVLRRDRGSRLVGGLVRRHGYERVRVRWQAATWLETGRDLEVDSLAAFVGRHGRLPRCNRRQELQKSGTWQLVVMALAAAGLLVA